MCWYGYYLFQLALPVALLYLTGILDREEGEKRLVCPPWPPLVVYVLSVLLVMSNDLHQLVFRFTPGEELGFRLPLRPGLLDRDGVLPPVPGIRLLEPAPQGT